MSDAPVTGNLLQTRDVLLHLSPEFSLDNVGILDHGGDSTHLVLTEISSLDLRGDARTVTDLESRVGTNPEDVSQRHMNALVRRDVHTLDSWHPFDPTPTTSHERREEHTTHEKMTLLALPLLVARIDADDTENSLTADQLASLADPLHGSTYLHTDLLLAPGEKPSNFRN